MKERRIINTQYAQISINKMGFERCKGRIKVKERVKGDFLLKIEVHVIDAVGVVSRVVLDQRQVREQVFGFQYRPDHPFCH